MHDAHILWSATSARAEPGGQTPFRRRGLCRILHTDFGERPFYEVA
jgi:hypothetical protein